MTGNQFALKVGTGVLYFDTDGEVWNAATQAGTWTTDKSNAIVFKPSDGSKSTSIPVRWRFDQDNYLWLFQGDTPVHQFGGTEGPVAKFTLEDNFLQVDPDLDDTNDFTFTLCPQWGLLDDGRLQVSVGKEVSTIDGYLESNDSGFNYRFVQLDRAATPMRWNLKFSGQWERAGGDSQLWLHFKLDDPAREDKKHPLNLPAAAGVDPKRNHLVFQFSGNGRSHLIQFQGSLKIRSNWTLAFTIKQSDDGNVSKSLLEVETSFEFDQDTSGNLVFYVGQVKTQDRQTLTLGGQVSLKLDATTGVTVNFKYSKSTTSTGTAQTSLAVGGQFFWNNGQINFSFQQDGATLSINVTAKIELGGANVAIGATIGNDPQNRKVTAFLRVDF
jgi:hypothetical protein